MDRLMISLEPETKTKLKKTAKALGVTPSTYIRTLILNDFDAQNNMPNNKDIQTSLLTLIPTLVTAMCKINRVNEESQIKLINVCLKEFKEFVPRIRNVQQKTGI